MLAVKRLAHVTLTTPDIERQVEYYTRVLGLSVVDREKNRAILATKGGHEAILLEHGAQPACVGVAFQVAPGSDLGSLASKLTASGIKVDRRSDITPRVGQALAFEDPKGTTVEIYSDCAFCPADASDLGIASRKLGHVAFNTTNVKRAVDFYCTVLGFRVSDWRTDVFAFLRCGPDHHSVNFVLGQNISLHHVAFEVRDEAEINRSSDLLAKKGFRLSWGPIRHIIGHSISAYHKNPDGLLMELFTDLDTMLCEELGYFEPRLWHQEFPQRPKVWPVDTPANWWGPASRWQGPEDIQTFG